MRFITEFELTPSKYAKYPHLIIKSYKSSYEAKIGGMIAESFGWSERGETTITGPVSERFTMEIEAFPMGKWVEFRKRFLAALPDYDNTSRIRLENALHDLESFGKPSGDTITNS